MYTREAGYELRQGLYLALALAAGIGLAFLAVGCGYPLLLVMAASVAVGFGVYRILSFIDSVGLNGISELINNQSSNSLENVLESFKNFFYPSPKATTTEESPHEYNESSQLILNQLPKKEAFEESIVLDIEDMFNSTANNSRSGQTVEGFETTHISILEEEQEESVNVGLSK